ncbi:MFS transporter, partial [Roseibium sp. RKSG952]|uniref:MFS transporter n=1 Tax=Roseibium sp. RKSG952 TaxID=2529384 RepID=UPI0018AD2804
MTERSEHQRRVSIVLALGIVGGLILLDETILGVALPTIRADLNGSPTQGHWVLNAYLLAFTCLSGVGGKCMDLFGLRRAMILSCTVFAASSLIAGFADSMSMLIAMRAIQGACAAVMFPLTFAGSSSTFPVEQRGKAMGLQAGTSSLFLVAGPLAGGFLTDFVSWRWIFWIN